MNKKGRISLVFLLLIFILSLIVIPFNSQVSAATSPDCVAGKGYGVKVALDPEHIQSTYEVAKFKPSEITPFDNINCDIWIKKGCGLTVRNIKTKLVIGSDGTKIISNSSVKYLKTEDEMDIYRWKIEGFDWIKGNFKGWTNDKPTMDFLIREGIANCTAEIELFGYGENPVVQDSFPIQNYLQLYGDKNAKNRVNVFLGKTLEGKLGIYVADVWNNIYSGLKVSDPYKTYLSDFSIFVNLNKTDESKSFVEISSPRGKGLKVESVEEFSKANGNEFMYRGPKIFIHDIPGIYGAYATPEGVGAFSLVFINSSMLESTRGQSVVIHEIGHNFCGLLDEYYILNEAALWAKGLVKGSQLMPLFGAENGLLNCLRTPAWDSSYGDYFKKCEMDSSYYKSSAKSLMNDDRISSKLNVISCGYCLQKIKGESGNNLDPYWQECLGMDTIKPIGIDQR